MPGLPVKADSNCNPGLGRQADEVGEFYFMHRCGAAAPRLRLAHASPMQSHALGLCVWNLLYTHSLSLLDTLPKCATFMIEKRTHTCMCRLISIFKKIRND